MQTTLKKTKLGELVRLKNADSGVVYIRGPYDRESKRFELSRFDNVNAFIFRKGTTLVFTGFTF